MKNPNIVALTEEIAALKENLNSIELEHKSLVQKRTKIRGELKDIKRALEVILETINSKESRIISIIEDINATGYQMQQLDAQMREIRDEIDEKELQIEKLRTISVLVYDTGNVEILGGEVEIPEWSELCKELLMDERMGVFTVNQIRSLAKAIVIKLNNNNSNLEFIFDSDKVEEVFKKFLDNVK